MVVKAITVTKDVHKYDRLLQHVLEVDPYVRSVLIVNTLGQITASQMTKDVKDVLTETQNTTVLEHTVSYWNYRKTLKNRIGNMQFILETYANLRRLAIPINEEKLLIITFEKEGGQKDIIERIGSIIAGDYTHPISGGPQY